jgi:hypothetical protein
MSTSPNEPNKLGGNTEARRIMKRAAAAALAAFNASYLIEPSTRSQTISYALLDSTVAPAAWMLDHDTDSYYKISRAFLSGPPSGNLTRDHILDNVTLYRLIGTGVSAARSYWESARAQSAAAGQTPPPSPSRSRSAPSRRDLPPRSWVQIGYPTLMFDNKPARGGHFAAWEEPHLFSEQLRAAFRSLRKLETRGSARRPPLVHVES